MQPHHLFCNFSCENKFDDKLSTECGGSMAFNVFATCKYKQEHAYIYRNQLWALNLLLWHYRHNDSLEFISCIFKLKPVFLTYKSICCLQIIWQFIVIFFKFLLQNEIYPGPLFYSKFTHCSHVISKSLDRRVLPV